MAERPIAFNGSETQEYWDIFFHKHKSQKDYGIFDEELLFDLGLDILKLKLGRNWRLVEEGLISSVQILSENGTLTNVGFLPAEKQHTPAILWVKSANNFATAHFEIGKCITISGNSKFFMTSEYSQNEGKFGQKELDKNIIPLSNGDISPQDIRRFAINLWEAYTFTQNTPNAAYARLNSYVEPFSLEITPEYLDEHKN